MSPKTTARRNLDKRLARLRSGDELTRPPKGWVRAIRDAIGMTAWQLAARMKVSQPAGHGVGKSRGRWPPHAQQPGAGRCSHAMGCTLVYALVPRRPLEEMVRDRARQIAVETLARVDHTMRLEGQGVDSDSYEKDKVRARLAASLVEDRIRSLWDART